MSRTSSYSHTFFLPAERRPVFELFADPARLDLLTPAWFRLRPSSGIPSRLAPGVEIRYRLRWRGLPLRWTSVITDWRPPEFFAYEQRHGPYRFFRHEHRFGRAGGGTEVVDHVRFRSPGGRLVDRLVARPDLRRIFAFRERRALPLLRALQAGAGPGSDASRMPRTRASSSPIERPT